MATLAEQFPSRDEPPRSQLLEAKVASGPGGANGVTVRLPKFDNGRVRWPVDGYPAREDDPSRGERCVVMFSDTGRLWILAFET
jgi:hypothetical protein